MKFIFQTLIPHARFLPPPPPLALNTQVAGPHSHSFLSFFWHRAPKTTAPPPELEEVAGPKAVQKATALKAAAATAGGSGGKAASRGGVSGGAHMSAPAGVVTSHSHEGISAAGCGRGAGRIGGGIPEAVGGAVAVPPPPPVMAEARSGGEDVSDVAARYFQIGPFRLPICFFGHRPHIILHKKYDHGHNNNHHHSRIHGIINHPLRSNPKKGTSGAEPCCRDGGEENDGDHRAGGSVLGGGSGDDRPGYGSGVKLDGIELNSTRRPTDPDDFDARAQAC